MTTHFAREEFSLGLLLCDKGHAREYSGFVKVLAALSRGSFIISLEAVGLA